MSSIKELKKQKKILEKELNKINTQIEYEQNKISYPIGCILLDRINDRFKVCGYKGIDIKVRKIDEIGNIEKRITTLYGWDLQNGVYKRINE